MRIPTAALLALLLAACTAPNPDYRPLIEVDDAGELADAGADLAPVPHADQGPLPGADLAPPADASPAPGPDLLQRDLGPLDMRQPPADMRPPADLLLPPDLAPTCGVKGLPCCPVNVCNDGSFCHAGACQTDCGIAGKPCCGGPGLNPLQGCAGWPLLCVTDACNANVGYCLAANGCGTAGTACCDAKGAPGGAYCAGDTHCSLAKCTAC
jgi:hypothetical protein